MVYVSGCDQTHEEVDPEALYRTFLLRVCDSCLRSLSSPFSALWFFF